MRCVRTIRRPLNRRCAVTSRSPDNGCERRSRRKLTDRRCKTRSTPRERADIASDRMGSDYSPVATRFRLMRGLCCFAVAILVFVSSAHHDVRGDLRAGGGASKNFVPDSTFAGSSLTGWRAIGEATWRADDGEIVATPKSGGWLMLDRPYEDVAVVASFRCAAGCAAKRGDNCNVLVRAIDRKSTRLNS